jgi:hypothetical protein
VEADPKCLEDWPQREYRKREDTRRDEEVCRIDPASSRQSRSPITRKRLIVAE